MEDLFIFYWATFLVGILSFGGGKAVIPMYKEYYVNYYHIISDNSLLEYIAYASSLPGAFSPMITGPVAFINYGWMSFFIAILLLAIPSILLFFLAMFFFIKYRNIDNVNFIAKYMSPAIICLLLFVVFSTLYSSAHNIEYIYYSVIIFILANFIFHFTKIHPVFVIIFTGLLGFIFL
jgi:chromate transporter